LAALQCAPPKHGSKRGHPTPIGWLTRGDHTVTRCSVIGTNSWWDLGGCLGRHKRGPPSGSACSSPRLRRDVPSFGPAVGEPVAGPHVTDTWPLGWAVGSIAGHALSGVGAHWPFSRCGTHILVCRPSNVVVGAGIQHIWLFTKVGVTVDFPGL